MRVQSTTLLQIFSKSILISKVIAKNMLDFDDNLR